MLLGNLASLLIAVASFYGLERWLSWKMEKEGGVLSHKFKVLGAFVGLVIVWVTGLGSYFAWTLLMTVVTVAAHACLHEPMEAVATEIDAV